MSTIFIVEDELKLALVLEKYLQAAGYNALIFDRGDVVVDAVREHSPDLILLDIMSVSYTHLTLPTICSV